MSNVKLDCLPFPVGTIGTVLHQRVEFTPIMVDSNNLRPAVDQLDGLEVRSNAGVVKSIQFSKFEELVINVASD